MARKKKHPEHVNHERWLVSYADFVTLLFAFFVVMFAVSQVDSKKVGRFTESFSKAVGIELFPLAGDGLMPGGVTPVPAEGIEGKSPLPEELNDLRRELVSLGRRQALPPSVKYIARNHELVIRMSDNLLFAPGGDTLEGPALDAVRALGEALASRRVDVRVEGHTDDRPIRTARFRSNWDLSTARAATVVAVLADAGIAPERLSAAGYGEFHPIAPNDTEDGRKLNRRVDLVVSTAVAHAEEATLDDAVDAGEPAPAPAPPTEEDAAAESPAPAEERAHGHEHEEEHP